MTSQSTSKRPEPARRHKKGDNTRQSILDAARECFNTLGISDVTCRTIAKEAGLSAGNVYYYFANKDEILLELTKKLDGVTEGILDFASENRMNSPVSREAAARRWMNIVWEWRFLFLDIHQLARSSPKARQDILNNQRRSIALHQAFYEEHLVKRGLTLTPADKKLCHSLAVTNWIVSVHWLQYMCLEKGEREITKADFDASLDQFMTFGRMFYDDNVIKRLNKKVKPDA